MSINRATILGNVGNDPVIRTTSSGREFATFSIATSERWRNKSTNELNEKTEWHRIVVFHDKILEIVKNYVKKGVKIYIEGTLHTHKWQDQYDSDHHTTEIILRNSKSTLQLLGDKIEPSSVQYREEDDVLDDEILF